MRKQHISKGIKAMMSLILAGSLVVTTPFVTHAPASSAAEEEGEVLTGTSWWSEYEISKDRILKGNGSVSFYLKNNKADEDGNVGFCIRVMALNEDGTKYITKDDIVTEEKGGYLYSSYNGSCGGWVEGIPAAKKGADRSIDQAADPDDFYNISVPRNLGELDIDHDYKVTVTRTDQEYLVLLRDITTDSWVYRQIFKGVDMESDIVGVSFFAQLGTYHMIDTQEHLVTDTTESIVPSYLEMSPQKVTAKPGEQVSFTAQMYQRDHKKLEGEFDLDWWAVKAEGNPYDHIEMTKEGVFTVPKDAKEGDSYYVYAVWHGYTINSSSAMATLTVSEKENTDITQEPEATPSQTTTTPPAPGQTTTVSPAPTQTADSDSEPTNKPASLTNKPADTVAPTNKPDKPAQPSATPRSDATKVPAVAKHKKAKITIKKDGQKISELTVKKGKKTVLKVYVNSQGKLSLAKLSKKSKKILRADLKNGTLTIKGKKKGKVTLKIAAAKTNTYKKASKSIKITVK